MQCPKCSRELFEVEQDRVKLDCCPGCKGLWFDRGELEKLSRLDSIIAKLRDVEGTKLFCPRCKGALFNYQTAGVIGVDVEHCRSCGGMWLDRSELEAFRSQSRRKRRPRPEGRRQEPEARTVKEFLLRFIDASLENLKS